MRLFHLEKKWTFHVRDVSEHTTMHRRGPLCQKKKLSSSKFQYFWGWETLLSKTKSEWPGNYFPWVPPLFPWNKWFHAENNLGRKENSWHMRIMLDGNACKATKQLNYWVCHENFKIQSYWKREFKSEIFSHLHTFISLSK